MNFEQLLDGATKGPWRVDDDKRFVLGPPQYPVSLIIATTSYTHAYKEPSCNAQLIARCNPAVMREVWAALKDVSSKIHDFEAGKINWSADFAYRVDRAIALLDGQTEEGGAE